MLQLFIVKLEGKFYLLNIVDREISEILAYGDFKQVADEVEEIRLFFETNIIFKNYDIKRGVKNARK